MRLILSTPMDIHRLCLFTPARNLAKLAIYAQADSQMTSRQDKAFTELNIGSERDTSAQAEALAELIKRVRTLRSQAAYHDLDMIAYLLHMAEVEARDNLVRMAKKDPREIPTPKD